MENKLELSPTQDRAIAALLNCSTIQEVAIELSISERSIYRWLQEDAFKAALRQARREALRRATIRLQQMARGAVEALGEVMADKDKATAASRVSAARVTLDFAYRAVELEDLDERVAVLEQHQHQQQ